MGKGRSGGVEFELEEEEVKEEQEVVINPFLQTIILLTNAHFMY